MMKKNCLDLTVRSVERLSEKHVLLRLTHDDPLPAMLPGQFVEVRVDHSPTTFLRRPISIHFVDRTCNELWLLVAAIGDGTRQIARLQSGDTVNCLLPLGNNFTGVKAGTTDQGVETDGQSIHLTTGSKVLLVGGGVGVAPLLWQGQQLKEDGAQPVFLLGAKTQTELLECARFEAIGPTYYTTEDGSAGEKGFVTNHSVLQREHFDLIQTCGPKPMMQSVARYARETETPCEASLENMMACGLGACLCCVEKTKQGNQRVCKEGPVFNILNLLW